MTIYRVIKRVEVNGKLLKRVLTTDYEFVHEDDVDQRCGLTSQTWKTARGAAKNAARFSGAEVEGGVA